MPERFRGTFGFLCTYLLTILIFLALWLPFATDADLPLLFLMIETGMALLAIIVGLAAILEVRDRRRAFVFKTNRPDRPWLGDILKTTTKTTSGSRLPMVELALVITFAALFSLSVYYVSNLSYVWGCTRLQGFDRQFCNVMYGGGIWIGLIIEGTGLTISAFVFLERLWRLY